jgi:DNA (cytosine-5)-methyltransferase 1
VLTCAVVQGADVVVAHRVEDVLELAAGGRHDADVVALVVPLRNNNTTKRATDPFDTFAAAGNHHGLLMPYYGNATSRDTNQPHGTFTTRDRYALVMRNNGSRTDGAKMCTPASETLRTLTTAGHQSLLEPHSIAVEDCLFRMLEPHEVAAGMAFTNGYVVLGNKREKVRQLGNAVTPPATRDLIAAVARSITTKWPG